MGVLLQQFINQFASNSHGFLLQDFQLVGFCHFHKLLYSLNRKEYQEIRSTKQLHRMFGIMLLISLIVYTAMFIYFIITMKTARFLLNFEISGFYFSVLCLTPIELYSGFSSITEEEVEQKRQAHRMRKLREARGAVPFGYIFREIIFPVYFWLYSLSCVVTLILLLTLAPRFVHIPLPLGVVVSGLAIIAGLFITYVQATKTYWSVKNLPHV